MSTTRSSLGRSSFLGVHKPDIGEDAIAEAADSLRSGWVVAGPKVRVFEDRLRTRFGGPHVCCLSAGTAALLLGLKVSGVGEGDEVLLPTMTFAACANVVEHLGARPILVDSEPETGLIDLEAAGAAVGGRTRAVLAVHLGGRPLNARTLADLKHRGVAVVEDAAHAIGAEWEGRPVGSHGNPTAFSFHATKNITTIEGGALALTDADSAARVRRLASQGLSRSAWDRHAAAGPADYDLEEPGYKMAMTDVSAAIGIHQIERLDPWLERREELCNRYDDLLSGLPVEFEPAVPAHARHARHLYAIKVSPDAPASRDEVIERLREERIGASVHFKPVHRLSYYRDRYGYGDGSFPVASDHADRVLSLPLYPSMDESDQDDVVAVLGETLA